MVLLIRQGTVLGQQFYVIVGGIQIKCRTRTRLNSFYLQSEPLHFPTASCGPPPPPKLHKKKNFYTGPVKNIFFFKKTKILIFFLKKN